MGFFGGVDQDAIVDLLKKRFFLTKFEPKNRENLHSLFWSKSQSIGRGPITREGAQDHRESRERRDKIFAAQTVKRQNFQKKKWIRKTVFSAGEFSFFGRGKTNFFV